MYRLLTADMDRQNTPRSLHPDQTETSGRSRLQEGRGFGKTAPSSRWHFFLHSAGFSAVWGRCWWKAGRPAVMPTKEPSYIQACARCNSKKIKCRMREGGACEQCATLDVECTYVATEDQW